MSNYIKKIAVLGDGGWGTTLSILLSAKELNVHLWGVFPDYVKTLDKKRVNTKFLPGIKIPSSIKITSSLEEAIEYADIIVFAPPSQHLRDVVLKAKPHIKPMAICLNASKGLELKSFKRMSEILEEFLGDYAKIATLSGPTIAYEVARLSPASAVIASKELEVAKLLQDIFSSKTFRIYTSDDLVGVELGGSLKNIVAIAAGISDGLNLGTNAKAALLTRGIVEITRFGEKLGAKKETFNGLSGIGDLITTCINEHSRNRSFGEEIGKGKNPTEIIKRTEMVVEGYATTKSVYDLSKKLNVELPITNEMFEVLYNSKSPIDAVKDLMTRSPKHETS